jgi:hypothetical protein
LECRVTTPHCTFLRSVDDVKELFKPLELQFRKRWFVIPRTFTISPENYLIISVSSQAQQVTSLTPFPLPGSSIMFSWDFYRRKEMSA